MGQGDERSPMMSTRYFLIAIVAAIAALTTAPIAGAGNTPVDDYWRDQPVASVPSNTIIDDYFRDVPTTSVPSNTIVDDYFRDAPTVVTSGSPFDWADFGIGVVTATGAMLLLAGVVLAAFVARQGRAHRTRSTGAA